MPPEPTAPLFSAPDRKQRRDSGRGLSGAATGIAVVAIALVLGIVILLTSHHHPIPNQPQPLDPYAASLSLSHLAMSESTSLSGGKSTFLDGDITNRGSSVVTAATAQVFFRNDVQLPPHIETVPISLIRTREPYIDTEPISAAPLAPGDTRPFRLIFESIPDNWNTQMPDVHIIAVTRH